MDYYEATARLDAAHRAAAEIGGNCVDKNMCDWCRDHLSLVLGLTDTNTLLVKDEGGLEAKSDEGLLAYTARALEDMALELRNRRYALMEEGCDDDD